MCTKESVLNRKIWWTRQHGSLTSAPSKTFGIFMPALFIKKYLLLFSPHTLLQTLIEHMKRSDSKHRLQVSSLSKCVLPFPSTTVFPAHEKDTFLLHILHVLQFSHWISFFAFLPFSPVKNSIPPLIEYPPYWIFEHIEYGSRPRTWFPAKNNQI